MTNKLNNRFYIKQLGILFFSTFFLLQLAAQHNDYTRPPLTDKWEDYKKQVKNDSTKKMVELKTMIPGILYDLRYASVNNFMRRLMYPAGTNTTFLRIPVVKALQKVQKDLNEKGFGLKIFDAYRPYSVTAKFRELVKDERYVANPSKGSGHNRGIAVELTIVNLLSGKELDMGTGFDNFSDTSHHTFTLLSEEILQNRQLLKSTMGKYGFSAYAGEWWHYTLQDAAKFEILDIDFKKLNKDL